MCAQCVEAERDDLAASLDTARGERDEARDEVTALRARVEALTAERAEAVAAARRSGAEAMRERLAKIWDTRAWHHSATVDRFRASKEMDLAVDYERWAQRDRAEADAIRALPLPGDATPAGEVTP